MSNNNKNIVIWVKFTVPYLTFYKYGIILGWFKNFQNEAHDLHSLTVFVFQAVSWCSLCYFSSICLNYNYIVILRWLWIFRRRLEEVFMGFMELFNCFTIILFSNDFWIICSTCKDVDSNRIDFMWNYWFRYINY